VESLLRTEFTNDQLESSMSLAKLNNSDHSDLTLKKQKSEVMYTTMIQNDDQVISLDEDDSLNIKGKNKSKQQKIFGQGIYRGSLYE